MHYAHICSFQSMHLAITVLYYVYIFSFLGLSPKSGLFHCLDMVNCASTVISHQARGTAIHLPGLCNFCHLKVARKPLPFKPPLDCAWLRMNKIIDNLHFLNHVNSECHTSFSPQTSKEMHPTANGPSKTFAWMARYKNIVCAMNKTHHLFYLHHMIM